MFNQKISKSLFKVLSLYLESGIGDFWGFMYSSFLIKKSDVQCSLNNLKSFEAWLHIFKYYLE